MGRARQTNDHDVMESGLSRRKSSALKGDVVVDGVCLAEDGVTHNNNNNNNSNILQDGTMGTHLYCNAGHIKYRKLRCVLTFFSLFLKSRTVNEPARKSQL
ncbi:hypothetical protein F2P81_009140 [Scophthalmus maximus]|uniref:Uncharacterized protein n=1 Tax=Scophthalmus maximus TaxID=52904 RepID=A0A6A4STU7_SCOMX|nr:hypothetical protein F2P81_009140 [Scophthalmus maximus]